MKYIVNDMKFNYLSEAESYAEKNNFLLTVEEDVLFPAGKQTMRLIWETANLLDDRDNLFVLDYEKEYNLGKIPKNCLSMFGHIYRYRIILKGDGEWTEQATYMPEPSEGGWQVYINGERLYNRVSGSTAQRIKNLLLKESKKKDSNIYSYLISLILIDPGNKSTSYFWKKNTPRTDLVAMEVEMKLF